MSGGVVFVYGDEYMSYRHSPDHPLQPGRVRDTFDLVGRLGLLRHAELRPPRQATDDEIALVHSRQYIDLVRRLGESGDNSAVDVEALRAGFGPGDNPVFPHMHEASAEIVGGSLVAAQAVHSGEAAHAFNPAGGLHHAMRSRASGFCVYDDPAVAIAWLRERGHRVAYVDVDVHHGDGVQALFYDDPDVLTLSLHESGRYLFPGTGFPVESGGPNAAKTSANLPFEPYAWDEPWLHGFDAVVPPILRSFRPTVLVTQCGCDTHAEDPLAHLQCSTRIWPHVGRRFHELAHELCDGRWLATGGGGYARSVVPRAWTLLFAEMVEDPLPAREALDTWTFTPAADKAREVWSSLEAQLAQLETIFEMRFAGESITSSS